MKTLSNNQKYIAVAVSISVITAALLVYSPITSKMVVTHEHTHETPEDLMAKFQYLSTAGTNFCAGPGFLDSKEDEDRIQGSCCSPMDFHRYTEQVEGLKKYHHIDVIPSDPYDIPVTLVRQLMEYRDNIELDEVRQKIYDEAMEMSMEGGPCCCKCWRWYAFEGQAKYLIKYREFTAEQIADVWDLEDGCGGEGHHDHGGHHT